MKWALISKLKEPAQKGAEPTEKELTALYQYFKRRNMIGFCFIFSSMITIPLGLIAGPVLANMFGALEESVVLGSFISDGFLMFLGFALIDDEEEKLNKPLADMSETDQAEAARLIRWVPEARKLNQRVSKQGRALRSFDLDAMQAFEKQRNEKRLLRQGNRLKIQAPGVSKAEA